MSPDTLTYNHSYLFLQLVNMYLNYVLSQYKVEFTEKVFGAERPMQEQMKSDLLTDIAWTHMLFPT